MSMPRMTRCPYCNSPPTMGGMLEAEDIRFRPDAEALAAAPSLKGKNAVVLYFDNDEDRRQFVDVIKLAKPGMRIENIE